MITKTVDDLKNQGVLEYFDVLDTGFEYKEDDKANKDAKDSYTSETILNLLKTMKSITKPVA